MCVCVCVWVCVCVCFCETVGCRGVSLEPDRERWSFKVVQLSTPADSASSACTQQKGPCREENPIRRLPLKLQPAPVSCSRLRYLSLSVSYPLILPSSISLCLPDSVSFCASHIRSASLAFSHVSISPTVYLCL